MATYESKKYAFSGANLSGIGADNIADGTDPTNYDTDGDWINDWFEIDDDMVNGVRGDGGSPIRYDDRTTS